MLVWIGACAVRAPDSRWLFFIVLPPSLVHSAGIGAGVLKWASPVRLRNAVCCRFFADDASLWLGLAWIGMACGFVYGKTRLTNNVNFGTIDFWKHALALIEDFHHFITVEFHVRALNVRIPSIARMVYMVGAPNRPYWREKRRHVTHFWLVDRDRVWLIKKYTAHCWRNVKECQASQEDQPLKGILKGFLKSFLKGFFKGFEILLPSNNFLSNVKRVCIESSSCPYSVADTTKNKQQQKV